MGDTAINNSALLPLEGGINFRDMGGYETKDGRVVRRGVLFRSGGLGDLTENDLTVLKDLSIKTILDYRDKDEAAQSPDRLWEGATLVAVSAISARVSSPSADPGKLIGNLIRDVSTSKEDTAAKVMVHLYSELPFCNLAYRRLFELLSGNESADGLVQHCALGKDRTGVGSALTLLALGVPVETVRLDYMKTEKILSPHKREILTKKLHVEGGSPLSEEAIIKLSPLMEARTEYLDLALDAIIKSYGTFKDYFKQEFALSRTDVDALRKRYLE